MLWKCIRHTFIKYVFCTFHLYILLALFIFYIFRNIIIVFGELKNFITRSKIKLWVFWVQLRDFLDFRNIWIYIHTINFLLRQILRWFFIIFRSNLSTVFFEIAMPRFWRYFWLRNMLGLAFRVFKLISIKRSRSRKLTCIIIVICSLSLWLLKFFRSRGILDAYFVLWFLLDYLFTKFSKLLFNTWHCFISWWLTRWLSWRIFLRWNFWFIKMAGEFTLIHNWRSWWQWRRLWLMIWFWWIVSWWYSRWSGCLTLSLFLFIFLLNNRQIFLFCLFG